MRQLDARIPLTTVFPFVLRDVSASDWFLSTKAELLHLIVATRRGIMFSSEVPREKNSRTASSMSKQRAHDVALKFNQSSLRLKVSSRKSIGILYASGVWGRGRNRSKNHSQADKAAKGENELSLGISSAHAVRSIE